MKKVYLKSKILLFLTVFLLFCVQSKRSQASTLILETSQINKLISKTSIFQTRIKLYRDRSIPEIIEAGKLGDKVSIILEENSYAYNQKTSIELLALPEVSQTSETEAQSTRLRSQLSNSLSRINWNKDTVGDYNSRNQSTVSLLPQADSGDIYRNIYDFDISLLDDNYIKQTGADNKNIATTNRVKEDDRNTDINLRKTQVSNYQSNYTDRFNFDDRVATKFDNFKSPLTAFDNNTPQNNPTNLVDSSTSLPDISTRQSPGLPENIDIAKYQINIQSSVDNSLNIPRTKEQQELAQKIAEQKKRLEQQRQELRNKLEKERQERARKRQEEARKLRQKRQEKLRQARQKQQQRQKQLQQSLLNR